MKVPSEERVIEKRIKEAEIRDDKRRQLDAINEKYKEKLRRRGENRDSGAEGGDVTTLDSEQALPKRADDETRRGQAGESELATEMVHKGSLN